MCLWCFVFASYAAPYYRYYNFPKVERSKLLISFVRYEKIWTLLFDVTLNVCRRRLRWLSSNGITCVGYPSTSLVLIVVAAAVVVVTQSDLKIAYKCRSCFGAHKFLFLQATSNGMKKQQQRRYDNPTTLKPSVIPDFYANFLHAFRSTKCVLCLMNSRFVGFCCRCCCFFVQKNFQPYKILYHNYLSIALSKSWWRSCATFDVSRSYARN